MRNTVLCFLLLMFLMPLSTAQEAVSEEDWSQFRGPGGQGHASARSLPTKWTDSENVTWKVPIPGKGWSSPVIQGEKIWLTTATEGGRSLRALCLQRSTGKIIHNIELFRQEEIGRIHSKNSYASPTPIIEGNRIFFHFGTFGSASLRNDGKVLWKNQLKYPHGHGPSSTPVLFKDLLIYNCDGRGKNVQFVAALDKNSGKLRWKRPRILEARMAYATPLTIEVDGKPQLVSNGGDQVVSYHPLTGKEIWWLRYDGFSNVPRPVYGLDLVFICSGYPQATLYAIRPNGRGDVTDSHVAWTLNRGIPLNPSPLLIGEELYLVSDRGIASCLNGRTGEIHWRERLGGEYSTSPVYADGKIFVLNEEGKTTIFKPGKVFNKVGTNQLPGRTLASIAVHSRAIYLRTNGETNGHLYRIEKAGS